MTSLSAEETLMWKSESNSDFSERGQTPWMFRFDATSWFLEYFEKYHFYKVDTFGNVLIPIRCSDFCSYSLFGTEKAKCSGFLTSGLHRNHKHH